MVSFCIRYWANLSNLSRLEVIIASAFWYALSNNSLTSSSLSASQGVYSLTVTDSNGCSITDTASIIINDVSAPTVIPNNIVVYLDANGQVSITAAQVDSASFDLCGIDTMSLDVYDFTCVNAGNQTVTLTVTDINGNTGSATATAFSFPLFIMLSK
mgnify:CR=1 FL=1